MEPKISVYGEIAVSHAGFLADTVMQITNKTDLCMIGVWDCFTSSSIYPIDV